MYFKLERNFLGKKVNLERNLRIEINVGNWKWINSHFNLSLKKQVCCWRRPCHPVCDAAYRGDNVLPKFGTSVRGGMTRAAPTTVAIPDRIWCHHNYCNEPLANRLKTPPSHVFRINSENKNVWSKTVKWGLKVTRKRNRKKKSWKYKTAVFIW